MLRLIYRESRVLESWSNPPCCFEGFIDTHIAFIRSLNLVDFARLNQIICLVDRKLPPADLIGAVCILTGVLGGPQYAVTVSGLEPETGVLAGLYFRGYYLLDFRSHGVHVYSKSTQRIDILPVFEICNCQCVLLQLVWLALD